MRIIKENQFIKVKMHVSVCNPDNGHLVDEYEMPFWILKDEWIRLQEEGCFSLAFENVITGYRTYFAETYRNHEISLGFCEY